jgi:hypothetical protein
MKKFIEKARIVSFVITLLTTIPLFFNYLKDIEPKNELIVHLHVWFGLFFFIFAITSMILNKKQKAN